MRVEVEASSKFALSTSAYQNNGLASKEIGAPEKLIPILWKHRVSWRHVPDEQKKTFLSSKCLMPISVGQLYHEDVKLKAALQCINRNFKEIIIVVGDTIQRYNHACVQNKPQEELCNFAKTEGDKWLDRNVPIIEATLTKPYQILRWDNYRVHSRFDLALSMIEDAYQNGSLEYRLAFNQDTENFLQRCGRNKSEFFNSICLSYLKEESACIYLWAEEGCEFLAYPGGFNNVFRATRKKFIEVPYNGILKEIPYTFKAKAVAQVNSGYRDGF
jgi:hypothetical protein